MKNQLKKLSKARLIELATDLLEAHERHYNKVKNKEYEAFVGFHRFSVNVEIARMNYDLPNLDPENEKDMC